MIYDNLNNEFQVIDYVATHSQLLIRSFKTDDRPYNIDIIFKGVSQLLIPTLIKGVTISVLDNAKIILMLNEKYNFEFRYGYYAFLIKDSRYREYYVNALAFGVFHTNLEILETSLGRYDDGNHMDELQFWYK